MVPGLRSVNARDAAEAVMPVFVPDTATDVFVANVGSVPYSSVNDVLAPFALTEAETVAPVNVIADEVPAATEGASGAIENVIDEEPAAKNPAAGAVPTTVQDPDPRIVSRAPTTEHVDEVEASTLNCTATPESDEAARSNGAESTVLAPGSVIETFAGATPTTDTGPDEVAILPSPS